MNEQAPLLRVCSLLNKHAAKYLVVGARACWLHGYVRATLDVDILVPEDLENHERIIAALSEMKEGFAAELTAQDFVDNIVVKIADEVEVDVSTRAWKVTYEEAQRSALRRTIDDVQVPYVDLSTLIRSKSTQRQQDRVDIENLRAIDQDRRR
ncbi:MAG TPA: hypothetical protein VGW57_16460 [Chthoniobacterales bacterium]|nr:hypothetical protein [Chthoniobacterales bacterium]